MKFKNLLLLFVCCTFWREILGISTISNNYDGLIRYLKGNSKVQRILFILERNPNTNTTIEYPVMNSLMKAVNSQLPSSRINYEIKDNKISILNVTHSLTTTTLAIIQWSDSTLKYYIEDMINNFVKIYCNPKKLKIVIVAPFLKEVHLTTDYFNYLYKRKIHDVAIIRHKKSSLHNAELKLNKSNETSYQLLHFNYYANKYTDEELSSMSEWFPNQLQYLKKRKMLVGCGVDDNSIVENFMNVIKLLDILKEKMNIVPLINIDFNSHLFCGKTSSELEEMGLKWHEPSFYVPSSEIILHTMSLDLDLILTINKWNQVPHILKYASTKAVIPLQTKLTKDVETSKELWYMILLTIGTIAILRFIVIVLKFNSNSWQTLSMSQIIMGMSTNQEPVDWLERVVFGSFLLGCIVYTNYFFSVILDLNFQIAKEISTFEELINSSLIPKVHPSVRIKLENDYKHLNLSSWLLKSDNHILSFRDPLDCLKYLSDHKSIICIIRDVDRVVKEYKTKYGELKFKILPETLEYTASTFTYELCSPYVNDFNKIMLKAIQYGLLEDFYDPRVPPEISISKPEMLAKEQIMLVLAYVLGIGYSLAFIVFILEVLTAKFKTKYSKKQKFSIVN